MAMLVGALTWLEKNQLNFGLKFENPMSKVTVDDKKGEETGGGFKFPAWFTDSKHRVRQFEQRELKVKAKFDEQFAKIVQPNNFQSLAQVLSKEDLELIQVSGRHGLLPEDFGQQSYKAKRRMTATVSDDEPRNNKFRVIYATRTHSQIQEFLSEFKKTKFVKAFSALELASRKHYCFNEKVVKFDNNNMMKEKCKEQRGSKTGCPYYNFARIFNSKFELFPLKVAEHKLDVSSLKLAPVPVSTPIVDIEDVVNYFQPKKVCAYFATKENSKYADVCLLE